MEQLNIFSNFLERKGNVLYFDGCNLNEIASEYGTPAYVLSQSDLEEHLSEIKTEFLDKYDNVLPLYASKALSIPYLYSEVERFGLGVDVVSSGEMYIALKAGTDPEKIYFHGSNKTAEEIEFAITHNVLNFVIDNFHEIELVENIAKEHGVTVRGMLRIVPQVKAGGHKYISTGATDTKFGFSTHDNTYLRAITKVVDSSHIEYIGVHCHIGSQILELQPFLDTARVMGLYVNNIHKELGVRTKELNIGGGYGIAYTPKDVPLKFKEIIHLVMKEIDKEFIEYGLERPKILIEPGRSIIGNSVMTIYTVGSRKEISGLKTYVSVDGSMADNIRTALYQAKYTAFLADTTDVDSTEVVNIAGKCCESGDILIYDAELPVLKAGNILAVASTGAYNYSMSSNYNQLRRPPIVLLNKGTSKLIVRRETYEDLIKTSL